ncbi:hypothetical protein AB1N83_012703 [Pleurotus pulmonarius]
MSAKHIWYLSAFASLRERCIGDHAARVAITEMVSPNIDLSQVCRILIARCLHRGKRLQRSSTRMHFVDRIGWGPVGPSLADYLFEFFYSLQCPSFTTSSREFKKTWKYPALSRRTRGLDKDTSNFSLPSDSGSTDTPISIASL